MKSLPQNPKKEKIIKFTLKKLIIFIFKKPVDNHIKSLASFFFPP